MVDAGRPLFAWVHYVDPHVPYHTDASIASDFDPGYEGRYALHFGWQPQANDAIGGYRTFPEDLPKPAATHRNPLSQRENEHIRRLYAADIRATDDQLRRLVERFRALYEDSIVVVTADHGERSTTSTSITATTCTTRACAFRWR